MDKPTEDQIRQRTLGTEPPEGTIVATKDLAPYANFHFRCGSIAWPKGP
jgi:hypothetical protein